MTTGTEKNQTVETLRDEFANIRHEAAHLGATRETWTAAFSRSLADVTNDGEVFAEDISPEDLALYHVRAARLALLQWTRR